MDLITKLFRLIVNPVELSSKLLKLTSKCWSDELYVKMKYRLRMGEKLNLTPPTTLSEKLNWLKLYYHNPRLHSLVDKYEVKGIVAETIGEEYVIPALGVWDNIESIDIDKLPDAFVLKCTHDSGSVEICSDKSKFDIDAAKKRLAKCLKHDYFWSGREWAYKGVKPRIIAEPFIPTLGHPDSVEYKLTVYNGKVRFVTVCTGIAHSSLKVRTNDHFTPEWERLPFYAYYKPSGKDIKKPPFMDRLIELTEKLAEGLPQVRVDWYVIDGKMKFGEMTFYTWSGFLKFEPKEWDLKLGSWFTLPEKMA